MNIELIRLCIESQRIGSNLEPNLALYQAKLQSNLTYLATMADVSMAKAGEVSEIYTQLIYINVFIYSL